MKKKKKLKEWCGKNLYIHVNFIKKGTENNPENKLLMKFHEIYSSFFRKFQHKFQRTRVRTGTELFTFCKSEFKKINITQKKMRPSRIIFPKSDSFSHSHNILGNLKFFGFFIEDFSLIFFLEKGIHHICIYGHMFSKSLSLRNFEI